VAAKRSTESHLVSSSISPPPQQQQPQPVVVGGIEFAASAKEARERMKKKGDAKRGSNLSLRDKYELLQKL